MMRIIKWIVSGIILLFLLSILLSFLFQQKIETAALKQLDILTNHQLSYEGADINYINSFPSISLDLTGPKLYDLDYNEAIQLEEFQIKLNLFKSIFSDPVISRLVIRNGSVTLRERNQKWNVEDLITHSAAPNAERSLINIDELIVENFKVILDRGTADQVLQIMLESATMELKNTTGQVEISALGLVRFDYLINSGDAQLLEIYDSFQSNLVYNVNTKQLDISGTQLDHGITANGWFNTSNSERNIEVKVEDLDANIFNTWIKNNTKDEEELIQLNGDISGIVTLDNVKDIDYTFYLKDFGLEKGKEKRISLSDLNSTMTGNQNEFSIQNFVCKIDDETVNGTVNYDISNHILKKLNIGGKLGIRPLYYFTNDSLFKDLKGHLSLERFSLHNINFNEKEIKLFDQFKFSATPENIQLQSNNGKWMFINNGELVIENGEIIFKSVDIALDDSHAKITGKYSANKHSVWELDIDCKKINLTEVMNFNTADTSSSENFLEKNRLFIKLETDELTYNQVLLKDVNVNLNSSNNVILLDGKGKAFSGNFTSDGELSNDGYLYNLHLNIDAAGIDLNDCMKQNENFGQDVITSAHVTGELNTLCAIDLFFNDKWNIQQSKTKAFIGAQILNGQIKNLEMMKQFSKFVNIKDLNNIKFTELNNYLEIQGKNLFIPTMFIQSNAANFTMSGYHSTENVQLYYLKVNAGQILSNKFKKHDASYSPKPAKQKGWFNLHYVITGTSETYGYKKDRSRVKAAFENGIERKQYIYNELVKSFGQVNEFVTED